MDVTLLTFIFGTMVLILIAGCLLWSGIVNQVERRNSHELAMKKLELKEADQTHKQWMEENGYRTYPEAIELMEEDKKKKGK